MKRRKFSLLIFPIVFSILFFIEAEDVSAALIVRPPNNLGLIGYWSLDEGRGTQASDMSGNGNDGVLNNAPTWTSGRSRGALAFDGVNDYVIMNDVVTANPTSFTIAGWFRKDGNGHTYECVLHQGSANTIGSSSFWMGIDLDDNLTATIGATTGVGWAAGQTTVKALVGEWNHMVASWDGSVVRVYINGAFVKQYNLSTYTNLSTPVRLGSSANGTNYQFNGTVDEVRIYNRGLSAAEVESLYSNTKSTVVGITPVDRYNNGLVGHWTFDGKHTTATTAEDIAGGNNGTIFGAFPTRGIIGQAMEFDGINDYIDAGDVLDQTGSFSISVWLNAKDLNALHKRIVVKDAGTQGWALSFGDPGMNSLRFFIREVSPVTTDTGPVITEIDRWYHVAAVFDTDTNTKRIYVDGEIEMEHTSTTGDPVDNTASLRIANSSPNFNGILDDVRIYNRALSAAEVAGLYSATSSSKMQSSTDELVTSGLIGHWSFDANTVSGGTVSDVSGNGKYGTVFGNPGPVAGKIGEAMAFDGVGDYIKVNTVGFSSNSITVAYWAQIQRTNGLNYAFDTNNERDSLLKWSDQNTSVVQWGLSGTYPTYNQGSRVNEWVHYVLVANGTNESLYINGVEVATMVQGEAIVNFEDLWIGSYHGSGYSMQGLLDDFRIYNRALSEEEITQLYSMGQ